MSFGNTLRITALAAALGGLLAPAFAQNSSTDMQGAPNRGMHMGQGMMQRGMMSGGCSEMMQSMNRPDGRPNSQWQRHSPGSSDNGG